ncbi:MAG: glycoside hydrolase family 172 protein [Prolixibacteraceae bacterium]
MKSVLLISFFMLVLSLSGQSQLPVYEKEKAVKAGPAITFGTLLRELTDRTVVARMPSESYRLLQASSYERKSVVKDGDGWYANEDWSNYIRKEVHNGREEYVVMDAEGPGAITRFWTGGHPKQKNNLRFFIDGSEVPFWEAETTGELIGQNTAIGYPLSFRSVDRDTLNMNPGCQPGHNLYAPILFQKHLKITSDRAKGDAGTGFWYNINYRLYGKDTPVESFSKGTPAVYKEMIDRTNKELSGFMKLSARDARGQGEKKTSVYDYSVNPQETKSFTVSKPGSLRRILLSLKADDIDEAVRDTWIRIRFDGLTTVEVPIGFFFGCGDQLLTVSDWYRKVDLNGDLACFWVMPYKKSAVVQLINKGKKAVAGTIEIAAGDWKWDDRSMYFHARYNPVGEMPAKTAKDFAYIDLDNQAGLYVGDVLQAEKWFRGWWGEGDEKIYIDGSTFPDHFGTGTEDYYGYAWGHPETFNELFITQPVGNANTGEGGVSVNSRVRSLDAIPFNKSFRFDMESWQTFGGPVKYAVACFWYGKSK